MSYANEEGGVRGWKRARMDAPVEERNIEDDLEDLIKRVALENTGTSLKGRLSTLAGILEADLHNRQDTIFNIIIRCVKGGPNNIGVCTSIIAIININLYNQCGQFVDQVLKEFKECLVEHKLNDARSMLKFLSDLVNAKVLMPSSLLHLYNTILSSLQLHHNKLYKEWLLGSVMVSLWYSGRELNLKRPEELAVLLSSLQQHLRERNKECLQVLAVWNSDDGRYEDELDEMWIGLRELKRQGWEEVVVPRSYLHFEEIKDALPHTIPPLSLPPPPPLPHHPPEHCPAYLPTILYPLPTPSFTVFDASDVPMNLPQLPSTNSIERFFVTECINTVLLINQHERKLCASALLSLEFRCKLPLHYLIIQSIFCHMLQPCTSDNVITASSILIELCKLKPECVPQVLAQATVNLYDRLNSMHAHSVHKFSRWFALHLNNFQFKWGWDDWMDSVNLPPLHPRSRFVSDTLAYSLRLSYYERVGKMVPDKLTSLLPPFPSSSPTYNQHYDEGMKELGDGLMKLFSSRSSVIQVSSLLQTTSKVTELQKVDVFVGTLLHASAKVISFTLNALSRYNDVLKTLTQSDKQQDKQQDKEKQVQVLLSMHSIWKNKPQMVEFLADKLLKTGVVVWQAIVSWSFSDAMAPYLTCSYMERVLHALLEHFHSRLSHHANILQAAKINLQRKKSAMDYGGYDEDEEEEEDDYDDDDKLKTEDDIDKEESRLNGLAQELRKAQCSVVKEMVERLSDLPPTLPFTILHHRLATILFKYPEYSSRNIEYLKASVFTPDLEAPIIATFTHFTSIYSSSPSPI